MTIGEIVGKAEDLHSHDSFGVVAKFSLFGGIELLEVYNGTLVYF